MSNFREVLDEMWNYHARWRFIGKELGIDTGTLDTIEADYGQVEDCLREMITIWLERDSPRPTRSAMKAALQSKRVVNATGKSSACACLVFQTLYVAMQLCI